MGYNLEIIEISAETHKIEHVQLVQNRVVLSGRNKLRDAIYGGVISPLTSFAVGSGSAPVVDTDVALEGELWRDAFSSRALGNAQLITRYYLTPGNQNGMTLREAGLFHADGTMYARTVFSEEIEKTSAKAVLFVWTLTWEAKT